jgi:hypothetical protein
VDALLIRLLLLENFLKWGVLTARKVPDKIIIVDNAIVLIEKLLRLLATAGDFESPGNPMFDSLFLWAMKLYT